MPNALSNAGPKTLVLAPSRHRFVPDDVRVGWRITCQNGEPYDLFWGSCRPERVASLLADVRREHGDVTLLDLREQPADVRHRHWVDAHTATPTA